MNDTDWVCIEGKPNKKFLHLEDTHISSPLQSLKKSDGLETENIDEVLEVLHDYY